MWDGVGPGVIEALWCVPGVIDGRAVVGYWGDASAGGGDEAGES